MSTSPPLHQLLVAGNLRSWQESSDSPDEENGCRSCVDVWNVVSVRERRGNGFQNRIDHVFAIASERVTRIEETHDDEPQKQRRGINRFEFREHPRLAAVVGKVMEKRTLNPALQVDHVHQVGMQEGITRRPIAKVGVVRILVTDAQSGFQDFPDNVEKIPAIECTPVLTPKILRGSRIDNEPQFLF